MVSPSPKRVVDAPSTRPRPIPPLGSHATFAEVLRHEALQETHCGGNSGTITSAILYDLGLTDFITRGCQLDYVQPYTEAQWLIVSEKISKMIDMHGENAADEMTTEFRALRGV